MVASMHICYDSFWYERFHLHFGTNPELASPESSLQRIVLVFAFLKALRIVSAPWKRHGCHMTGRIKVLLLHDVPMAKAAVVT
jgi:hypothetical protein